MYAGPLTHNPHVILRNFTYYAMERASNGGMQASYINDTLKLAYVSVLCAQNQPKTRKRACIAV